MNEGFNERVIRNIPTLNLLRNSNTLLRCNTSGISNNTYTLSNHLVQCQFLFLFLVKQGRVIVSRDQKDRILKQLLVHDLGELIVGDIPSPSKTNDLREEEDKYFRILSSELLDIDELQEDDTKPLVDYVDALELLIECERLQKSDLYNAIITETIREISKYLFELEGELIKLGYLKRADDLRTIYDDLLIRLKLRELYYV